MYCKTCGGIGNVLVSPYAIETCPECLGRGVIPINMNDPVFHVKDD